MPPEQEERVAVGQTYERVQHPLTLHVRSLNYPYEGCAMCHMFNDKGDYGLRPVPFGLLRNRDVFRLRESSRAS